MIKRDEYILLAVMTSWDTMSDTDKEGCTTPEQLAITILTKLEMEPDIAAEADKVVAAIWQAGYVAGFDASKD